nr:glycosyltransferase family 4 protein [uncultured Rhodopila sp.]
MEVDVYDQTDPQLHLIDKTMTLAPQDKIRVMYFTPGGIEGRGGMGQMARYLAAKFESRPDIHLQVLDTYGLGPFGQMLFHFSRSAVKLGFACVRGRVDVAHIHMSFGGSALRKLFLLRIADMFGVPTILHLHGSKFAVFCDQLSPVLRGLLVRTMARASKIVVIGSFWRHYLTEDLRIDESKIEIIANGVPLPDSVIDRNRLAGPCRIVYLGALGPRKGTYDLLKALSSPSLQALNWEAVIAGNGAVDDFRAEAAALGLADRVTFPGWIGPEAAQSLLATAKIFVLPSYNEGLPVALLEAMATGLPVVTTPVGAIPDLGIDGEAGFLVTPGSIDELADRLVTLVGDEDLRLRFGHNGRQRIERDFTIDITANRLAALYRGRKAQRRKTAR